MINALEYFGGKLGINAFNKLKELTHIKHLYILNHYISTYICDTNGYLENHLGDLTSLKHLQTLEINAHPDAIPFIDTREMESLSHLILFVIPQAEQLINFNHAPNLKTLTFKYRYLLNISFDAIERLSLLDKISSIRFYESGFSADYILAFNHVSMPSLEEVAFIRTKVSGLNFDTFAPNAKRLYLPYADIKSGAVQRMKTMTRLEEIDLTSAMIGASAIKHLSKLPQLKKITLNQTKIAGADFSIFADHSDLEELNLSGTNITKYDLKTIHGLKQLKRLDITNRLSETISPQDIQELIEALPNTDVIVY
jgi:Leucine-rich repeat (LRR) protein